MARMRILITGITGFVGSHLTEWALSRGADVIGALRWRSNTEHIEHLRDRLTLIESDLRDLSSVLGLVEQAHPDYIVHLAAQSFVAASWLTPAETLLTNAISQMNLFEAGLREPVVSAGDLKPTRDFSDVRDVVRGYWALLERGSVGEVYNLCSGTDWSIERVLQFLIAQSKVSGIQVRTDQARLRPSDVPVLRGCADKIEAAVGWRTRIPVERTLSDLLDYWRQRIRR